MSDHKQPVHRIRIGNISAAIFENQTDQGTSFYNAQFQRGYRTADGWRNTRSFGRDDLLALAKLADQTHSWIQNQIQSRNSDDDAEDGEE
ncbi:hypothetical protein [Planctomicrobium sp. SH664]|uniref:hypothetical protein n=1 Tax=Planctomicrobium sp. SH664 TaxID=3448125 RepID=UPI003F5B3046